MANIKLETAFNLSLTPKEAVLLKECFEVAEAISCNFGGIAHPNLDAANACYELRSDGFKALFPPQEGEEDPFARFLSLWSDPDCPEFGPDLEISIGDDESGKGQVAFIRGDVDPFPLASLIQKVCWSALPFGFEWGTASDKLRPGHLGGGYYVITDAEIIGGSTRCLMEEAMQTLRAL